MKKMLSVVLALSLLVGCSSPRIHGGKSSVITKGGAKIEMVQGEDAKASSGFNTQTRSVKEYVIPAGSKLILSAPVVSVPFIETKSKTPTPTNITSIVISSNMPVREEVTESVEVEHGKAQKNVLGESIAKLNSLKWVSWIGVFTFLFGLATLFYPPLKAIINSLTTSLAFVGGGLLLTILPVVIVGNEILILVIVGGAVLAYFLVYRHGAVSATAKQLQKLVTPKKG